MSSFGASAIDFIIGLQGRVITLTRFETPTDTTVSVKMAPSNRIRQLENLEEFTIQGLEYVVSKKALDAVSFPAPEINDRVTDVDLGNKTIIEVIPMIVFGDICAYRLRME